MRRILLTLVCVAILGLPAVASAQFGPRVSVFPVSGEVGDTIRARVDGFGPGTVELYLDAVGGSPLASAFISPDGDGGADIRFVIPRSTTVGTHALIACMHPDVPQCGEEASTKLLVTAPPTTTTTTTTTTTSTTTSTTTAPPSTTTSTTTTSAPDIGVVTTTTSPPPPGEIQATTLPPTTTLADAVAVPTTTVGGDPVPPPPDVPQDFGATTTTTQPDLGAFPTQVDDIELVAIEITQGLQNLDNDFPLIQDRPTWVRVHAITHDDDGIQANVDAAVLVIRDGAEMGILWPENTPVTLPGEMDATARGSHAGTPYMQIPPDWVDTEGTIEVRAIVFAHGVADASNEADPTNNVGSATAYLDTADQATIHYFPIFLEDEDGQPLVHDLGDGYLHEHLMTLRIWPIANLNAVPHWTVIGDEDSNWVLTEEPDKYGPNLALAELFAESGLDASHQYMGMAHNEVETGTTWGIAAAGTTWTKMGSGYGEDGLAWRNLSGEIAAHEAGHWAGLLHAPCKGGPGSLIPEEVHGGTVDASFPATYSWPSCSLAPNHWTGYYGFDPMPWAPGTDAPAIMSNDPSTANPAFPFMGYVSPHWTDPYHGCRMLIFLGVPCDTGEVAPVDPSAPGGGTVPGGASGGVPAFDCDMGLPGEEADFCDLQLGPSGDPTAAPPSGPQQMIFGLIDWINGEHALSHRVELASRGEVEGRLTGDAAAEGPYVLALVDGDGDVQWATTLDTDDSSAHGAGELGPTPFAVRFPTFDDTARVILAKPGEILAELTPSAVPTVEITDVDLTDDALLVDIAIDDPDTDTHRTSVQYRPDGDADWVVLAAGSTDTSFRFPGLADLPTSDDGELLVRVSDGFSTGQAVQGAVVIPDQAPTVTVLAPIAASTYDTLDAIQLDAHGIDADAGFDMDALDYRWESDVDGLIATDRAATVRDLSAGEHTLTVAVTDAGGNTTTASVDITVVTGVPVDADMTDVVGGVLRGPIQVLGPVAVDIVAPLGLDTPGGDDGCTLCVPLALGGLSALVLAVLAWRWNRPRPELAAG